jgi:FkbM family methyltransferase
MSSGPIESLVAFLTSAPHDASLYEACRGYALRYDGEGNADPETNGEFEVLSGALPGRRLAIDVGAHRGVFIERALRINPSLEIHAFEPDPRSYADLQAKHYPASVTIRNLALGDRAEDRDLWMFGDFSEISTFHWRALTAGLPIETPTGSVPVKVITLDTYCSNHGIERVDFLKIDAEGHDLKVLQGGRELLATGAIGAAQFEFGAPNIFSGDLLKDFFGFFEAFPYALYKIHPKWVALHERYDPRLENFTYQNWIAVRRP